MQAFVVPATAATVEPMGVIPIGKVADWFASAQYPADALRARRQGQTVYELSIDANGSVASCKIIKTSGTITLDEATCNVLRLKAKFDPAKDRNGVKMPSKYRGSIAWRLPDAPVYEDTGVDRPAVDSTAAEYEVVIGRNGLIESCKVLLVSPADSVEPCKYTLVGSPAPVEFKRGGKFRSVRVVFKKSVTVTVIDDTP